jgi:aryl-alcohol dehydrogenase-like predicted oxidoreductase
VIYNLVTRDIELEVLPAAAAYGIGVLAWSPLHHGLLGGILRHERADGAPSGARCPRQHLDTFRPQLEKYESLCAELGEEAACVALAWLFSRAGLTGIVTGPAHGAPRRGAARTRVAAR